MPSITERIEGAQVMNYTLRAANGRIVRTATKVILADGTQVPFMERMSRAEALRQVRKELERNA